MPTDMLRATHLIKVWYFDTFPESFSDDRIQALVRQKFRFLGDKLENVVVENLKEEKKMGGAK